MHPRQRTCCLLLFILSIFGFGAGHAEDAGEADRILSRCFAFSQQERLSDDQLVELTMHLQSGNDHVRWAAAWSLAQAKDLPLSAIKDLTNSGDVHVQRTATYVLSERAGNSPDAYTALLPLRTDEDGLVRRLVLDGLHRFGANRTELIPALVAALKPYRRTTTGERIPDPLLYLVQALNPPTTGEFPALVALLKHDSAMVRESAHRQLLRTDVTLGAHYGQLVLAYEEGRLRFDKTAATRFADMQKHRERIAKIIIATCDANGLPTNPEWLVTLAVNLDVAREEVTDQLVQWLLHTAAPGTQIGGWIGKLAVGSDKRIADVAQMLQHRRQNVRTAATVAMAEIGPAAAAAIPSLRKLLNSGHHDDSLRAAIALYSIGPAASEAAADLWKSHPVIFNHSESFRMRQPRYTIGMFGPSVLPIVMPVLEQTDDVDQQTVAAIDVVEEMGTAAASAVPALQRILQAPVPDVRSQHTRYQRKARVHAAQALARIRPDDPELTDDILAVLSDEDLASHRAALFQVLLDLQPDNPQVLERLNAHLEAPDRFYRVAAVLLATHGVVSAETIAQVYDQRSRNQCAKRGKHALQQIALDDAASYQARDHAARSLATLDIREHPELANVFATLLHHPARDLRNFAATTLAAWGEPGLTPVLDILKSPNTEAWHTAVAHLDQFGPLAQRAVPILEHVAESSTEGQRGAIGALRKIRRSEFAVAGQTRFVDHYPVFNQSLGAVLDHIENAPDDVPAVRQLRFFGPAAAPFLADIAVANERTVAVRQAAVSLLSDERCREHQHALLRILKDYNESEAPTDEQRRVARAVCQQIQQLADHQAEAKRLVQQLIGKERFPPQYQRYVR